MYNKMWNFIRNSNLSIEEKNWDSLEFLVAFYIFYLDC